MDIDGYTFDGYPVQVKHSDDVGRNVIDNFETAMHRANAKKGVIVAFSFGRGPMRRSPGRSCTTTSIFRPSPSPSS